MESGSVHGPGGATFSAFTHPKQQAGFDESELREFNKALKQNLLVQTPLQVLLETMFARLQSQAQMFHDLHDRIEHLESKDSGNRELVLRVQSCEAQLAELRLTSMGPTKQQELAVKLTGLEQQLAVMAELAEHAAMQTDDMSEIVSEVEGRLEQLEVQAAQGVRMGAPTGGSGGNAASPSAAGESGDEAAQSSPVTHAVAPRPRRTSRPGSNLAALRKALPQSKDSPAEGGAPASFSAIGDLAAKVDKLTEENKTLSTTVEALTTSLNEMTTTLDELRASSSGRIKGLESAVQHLKANMIDEIASIKGIVTSVSNEPRVGIVEFTQLQQKMELAVQGLQSSSEAFEDLRHNDIPSINEAIAELQLSSKRVDDTSSSLMEAHQRLAAVDARLEDVKNELSMTMAEALDACAKLADLEEMAKEIDSKATSHEIKQLAQQQAALAQSVNGMAEWLAVRPDPDGNKGPPSLTKFKCLTCDRELRTATQKGGAFARGGLLPKLDGMTLPHSSVPGGPGLHAAEKRQLSTTSPPPYRGDGGLQGQDYADYSTIEETRTIRTTRTADGRVALPMPAGGLKVPPGPKTPVFIA